MYVGLYQVDVDLKEAQKDGLRLFAIGDLNNDKQNDIVTVNDKRDGFSVHYFRQKDEEYKFDSGKDTPVFLVPDGYKI
jgi:hypothetical protein